MPITINGSVGGQAREVGRWSTVLRKRELGIDRMEEKGRTTTRILSLLVTLVENGEAMRLNEIADRMNLPPSTVHRMLQFLLDAGMAQKDAAKTYGVGPELYRLNGLMTAKFDLKGWAAHHTRTVVAQTAEACFFCLYMPHVGMISPLHVDYGQNPLRYSVELNVPMTMNWGASGLAVLANLEPDLRQRHWRESEPSPVTGLPQASFADFEHKLSIIRQNGYVETAGEKMPGAVGFAAPVFGADGLIRGSLCVTVPAVRFEQSMRVLIVNVLVDVSRRMTTALGGDLLAIDPPG